MLIVGQGCFYGMVMESETSPSMVINHLVVWFCRSFFTPRMDREGTLFPVNSKL
ncbi:hypothetical protein ASPBRDRAFT_40446 [Aspergillus brasiliensis CBS 101740]|uniref:Uncharacterized protein n=1 Tax=Aspergillus brasiliensis (strain CBS 101740 / IMI 381727 / IBT 21946) TaxID=767769 RepID=A0A1L9UTV1_ASPBC|nr:hypothetical protein ASPBRDRAFT_40446 [Aspergillus brasiliensis CBS 101740]